MVRVAEWLTGLVAGSPRRVVAAVTLGVLVTLDQLDVLPAGLFDAVLQLVGLKP